MAEPQKLAIAVLAAGESRRFGEADKLAQEIAGKPLIAHVCKRLVPVKSAQRWIVASAERAYAADGYQTIVNPDAQKGLGTSVACAARSAISANVDALLLALADMPLVTSEHFLRLARRAASDALFASHNGSVKTPPAIFGRRYFARLAALDGSGGARALLENAQIVECDEAQLADIDTPQDLARLSEAIE